LENQEGDGRITLIWDLREVKYEDRGWMELAEYQFQGRALVLAV
jgi:hypothetical protein